MKVGRGPGHIVLDGDPASLPKRGTAPPAIFGPCLLWPNGWMDQDATWYEDRPRPGHTVLVWGPSSPQRGAAPNFCPVSIVAKRSSISATDEHLFVCVTIGVAKRLDRSKT